MPNSKKLLGFLVAGAGLEPYDPPRRSYEPDELPKHAVNREDVPRNKISSNT
ncbi:MAG: hypothetical protein R2774_15740 [Saprospiraceae bacterium]